MYIKKITLNNFGSYLGERILDFETTTGQHGYAIFGEIGRGKTTLVEAVLWCLYGRVEASRDIEGRTTKKNRPLIDAAQMNGEFTKKWYLPLLNFQAWYNSDFNFSVRIEFEHEGRNFSLLRDVTSNVKKPKSDNDVKHQPHLQVDGKTVTAALISNTISEIIPERIAKFFFVEVDSIKSYSTLLDSDGSVGGIVDDVEAILGMPALENSKDDFKSLAHMNNKKLEKINTADVRNKKVKDDLKVFDTEIGALTKAIDQADERIKEIGVGISDIDQELSENIATETHMTRLTGARTEKLKLEGKMEGYYSDRQRIVSNGSWKFLLQSKIEAIIIGLSAKEENKTINLRKIAGLTVRKDHLDKEIKEDGAKCESCGFVSSGIEVAAKLKKSKEIIQIEGEIEDLQKINEILGHPSKEILELTKYRDSSAFDSVKTLEKQIGIVEFDIGKVIKTIGEVTKDLMDHDISAIQRIQADKIKLIEERGDIKGARMYNIEVKSEINTERSKRAGDLVENPVLSPQTNMYKKCEEIFIWLENIFENTLTEFKNDARVQVEDFATIAWKNMIPDPEKYKEIKINSFWNTEVISATGKALPIGNPGHRQTLAVCLFDGLRKTSKRRFPTFFDNPGSNIGNYTLEKMASHFWTDAKDQIVMLSHGGGLERTKTMKTYGTKLARAWELTYAEGDKTTTEVKVVTS